MYTRIVLVRHFIFAIFCGAAMVAQQNPTSSTESTLREFPVILQQNVVAGKTPVGTKIRAKLGVATLVDGKVYPRNAVFSGEVIQSVAKTAVAPSFVAIRMNSAQWKNGSASILLYLTPWYYPTRVEAGQELQYGPTQPANKTWNGAGAYPDPNSRSYKPFPSEDSGKDRNTVPDTPSSTTANHRILLKDVQSARNSDGSFSITSSNTNIKLDKLTTYILATSDLLPVK